MSSFFNSFRTVQYDGQIATRLLSRLNLSSVASDGMKVFYTYSLKDGERPDQVAASYYGNESLDWLVYLSNQVKDPYFEWLMDDETLNRKIVQKYGSIAKASTRILFWQDNSRNSESILTTSAYAALPAIAKKYWVPILDSNDAVAGYERKKVDHAVDTNVVVDAIFDTPTLPAVGERLTQNVMVMGVPTTASARVCAVESNGAGRAKATLNNVVGQFGAGQMTYGEDSGFEAVCVDKLVVAESFSAAEAAYWSPVSALSYEHTLNESRRQIYLISSVYADAIQSELRQALT